MPSSGEGVAPRRGDARAVARRCAAVLLAAACVFAEFALGTHVSAPEWEIAQGGRLYDRWYDELMVSPPFGRNPLYQSGLSLPDVETWRCVTCHGWDYRGGANGTSAPGLTHLQGRADSLIADAILAPRHGFTPHFPPAAVRRLAALLSRGQPDVDAARAALPAVAHEKDWIRGAWLFATICAVCHGMDGTALALPYGGSLASIARAEPARFLHKVRFGEPDSGMVALTLVSAEDRANILAFAQRLGVQ